MKIFSDSRGAAMVCVAAFLTLVQPVAQVAVAVSAEANIPAGSLIISGPQSSRPAGSYSKSVTEIIGMLDAKVDAQVIAAYIKSANVPYQPEAVELIALKEHGATTDVQLALLNRSAELRAQYSDYLKAVRAQAAPSPASVAQPVYSYPQTVAYPEYADSSYAYPDSYCTSYPYYGYSYWPSYLGYGFSWRWVNGRWCRFENHNFGRFNNSVHWNGGFNNRFGPSTSHAAFVPVRSAPTFHSGGFGGGGVHVTSGGARGFGHSSGRSR